MDDYFAGLSETSKTMLRLAAKGRTSKEIAAETRLSHQTIDVYFSRMMKEMGVARRQEAAALFLAWEETGEAAQSESRSEFGLRAIVIGRTGEPASFSTGGFGFWRKLLRGLKVPPVGGGSHDLNAAQKTFLALRIAVISTAVVIVLALLVAGALITFS